MIIRGKTLRELEMYDRDLQEFQRLCDVKMTKNWRLLERVHGWLAIERRHVLAEIVKAQKKEWKDGESS